MTDNFLVPQTKSESMLPKKLPCPFSAAGMQQPSHLQPPPMFGPRGSTIPPKHLSGYAHFKINRPQPRQAIDNKNFNRQYSPKESAPRYHYNIGNDNRTQAPQRYQRSREFWCEPCDRDFRSEDLLHEHKSQHQKCGIDGCKFEGHEIIVNKHIHMQHSTGLYERLKNLETPEDIQKWREERRKRYPTKANIELRQQMQEERNKRGEKLGNSKARFGRNSDRRRCNNNSTAGNHVTDRNKEGKPDNKQGRKKRRRVNRKTVATVEQREDENDKNNSDSNNGLPMFSGTSQMKNYKKRKETQPKNALSGLLGIYESDSDSNETSSDDTVSNDEMEIETSTNVSFEETCIGEEGNVSNISEQTSASENELNDSPQKQPVEVNCDAEPVEPIIDKDTADDSPQKQPVEVVCDAEPVEPIIDKDTADDDMSELPSEEPIEKAEQIDDAISTVEATTVIRDSRTKRKVLDQRLSKRPTVMNLSKKFRNQNTMLEKLLQNEIRHERNVLLQCVRHVVKENFFGIGQKPASS